MKTDNDAADHPDDCCACGDYRKQHKDGTGRCLLGDLCTPYPCRRFRLHYRAADDPMRRRALAPAGKDERG